MITLEPKKQGLNCSDSPRVTDIAEASCTKVSQSSAAGKIRNHIQRLNRYSKTAAIAFRRSFSGRDIDPADIVRFIVERGANAKSDGFVYFIQDVDSGNVKIGFSVNPFIRAAQLGAACRVVAFFPAARAAEFDMHELFLGSWISGEWFGVTDEMTDLIRLLRAVGEWESLGIKLPLFECADILGCIPAELLPETVPPTVTLQPCGVSA